MGTINVQYAFIGAQGMGGDAFRVLHVCQGIKQTTEVIREEVHLRD